MLLAKACKSSMFWGEKDERAHLTLVLVLNSWSTLIPKRMFLKKGVGHRLDIRVLSEKSFCLVIFIT